MSGLSLSRLEILFAAFDLEGLSGLSVLHADQLVKAYVPPFSPDLPALLVGVLDVAAVRAILLNNYRPEHIIRLLSVDGSVRELLLADWRDADSGSVFIPARERGHAFETFHEIIAHLRAPEGCPWDRKQTNASLAQALVDEVYEVIDAIETGDDVNLAEELGDLQLLIMMHAQIAEERDAFRLEDVYHGISAKIVRRHPHVFGDLAASNAEEVVGLWQQVKSDEKKNSPSKPEKAADGQPHSMPAITRATRVLKKHPIHVKESTQDSRQRALLEAIAAIVVAGDDPEEVLKSGLENHVAAASDGSDQGEINASR